MHAGLRRGSRFEVQTCQNMFGSDSCRVTTAPTGGLYEDPARVQLAATGSRAGFFAFRGSIVSQDTHRLGPQAAAQALLRTRAAASILKAGRAMVGSTAAAPCQGSWQGPPTPSCGGTYGSPHSRSYHPTYMEATPKARGAHCSGRSCERTASTGPGLVLSRPRCDLGRRAPYRRLRRTARNGG
jgi:hypothetical protein